jgi:hypothetical protein
MYIEEFRQSEGILLYKESIWHNASKRGLAKLCLNSIWGKLADNSPKTQTQIFYDPQDLYRFWATPGIEVTTLLFAVCWIAWRHTDEAHDPTLRHTNDVIASYVTAGGRLHLYSYLDTLQERALYTDTNSVIFIQPRDGTELVETGDCLGAMTSVLKTGEIISEFVSGGQKTTRTKRSVPWQAQKQLSVKREASPWTTVLHNL